MTIPKERALATSVDTDEHGNIRLRAGCDDEQTDVFIINPEALGMTPQDMVDTQSQWGPALLADHMAQCESCQKHMRGGMN